MANHNGRFKTLYGESIDIFNGHNLLESGYDKLKEKSIKVSYSELINNSELLIEKLNIYLDVKINSTISSNLASVQLSGSLGDPKMMSGKFNEISNKSLNKWKKSFKTPIRRWVAIKYLNIIIIIDSI